MDKPKLYDFQNEGAKFLTGKRLALLADEMGIGKTAQAITACDRIGAKRVLIICPSVAKINWQREFVRFSERGWNLHRIETRRDLWHPEHSLVVSFSLAAEIPPESFGRFDVMIVDESHFLKSTDAKRTKAIMGAKGLIRQADRTWLMSGTPAPNHAGELWIMMYTFGLTSLNYEEWVKRYCTFYHHNGRLAITGTNTDRVHEIRAMLSKIMLRRRKKDVLPQLPPITFGEVTVPKGEVDIEVESSFTQYVFPIDRRKELVDELENQERDAVAILDRLGHTEAAMQALEAMAKSVSTLRRYRGLQKVEATLELVADELRSNAYEKLVIFAIHRDVIENLRKGLKEFKPVTLYGGFDDDKRQRNIDKFQKDKKCRVFIANIQAAGPSITLTAAHNIVFIEQDWVPGNNAQAAMRCHRIGQTMPVFVRVISLDDPVDTRVSAALRRKTKELLEILD